MRPRPAAVHRGTSIYARRSARSKTGPPSAEASTLDSTRIPAARAARPGSPSVVPGAYGPRELRGISPTYINSRVLRRGLAAGNPPRQADRRPAVRSDGPGAGQSGRGRRLEPSGFEREFRWWSWRAGGVVNLRRDLVAYGQYSDAKDPVNANLVLVGEPGLRPDRCPPVGGGPEGGPRRRAHAGDRRLVRHRAGRHSGAVPLDSATTIGGIAVARSRVGAGVPSDR